MITDTTFKGAKDFARWMLKDDRLRISPAPERIKVFAGVAMEIILFQEACWQAELICGFPFNSVPQHWHAHVDSYELLLGGNVDATMGGKRIPQRQRGAIMANLVHIPVGVAHGGVAGRDGVVWLSFQHWKDGAVPNWITADWHV